MRNITLGAACAAALSFSLATPAAADRLSAPEIRDFIGGKRVVLNTRYGGFPMYYQANGRVTGDGTGTGLGRFFAPKETGKWWVSGNQMCQQFPTWYDGKALCFEIQKTGNTTLNWFREDGAKGTAQISG